MIDQDRISLIIKILEDYQRFKGRKVTDKRLIHNVIAELKGERIRKKRNDVTSQMISKTEFAERVGINRKTLIKIIEEHDELYDELKLTVYKHGQYGFTPKQVEIIKEFLGLDPNIADKSEGEVNIA